MFTFIQSIWQNLFTDPFAALLTHTALILGDSYGLAIIALTLGIRFLLMPLVYKQQRNQKALRDLQPELEAWQHQYCQSNQSNGNNPKQAQRMAEEMLALYRRNGASPLGGCWPALLQLPVLMALYWAILGSKEVATHSFLWFELGVTDPIYILPVLVALTAWWQSKTTLSANQKTLHGNGAKSAVHNKPPAAKQKNGPHRRKGSLENEETQKELPQAAPLKAFTWIVPIMMVTASLYLPAALSRYWWISNLFIALKTTVLQKLF
jgi:YidC/Oxa1 family membrane protein insertase